MNGLFSLIFPLLFLGAFGVLIYSFVRSQRSDQKFIDVLKATVLLIGMTVVGWATGIYEQIGQIGGPATGG